MDIAVKVHVKGQCSLCLHSAVACIGWTSVGSSSANC